MLIITAPSKTQDFTTPWSSKYSTQPEFLLESSIIIKQLEKLSIKELSKLYHSSKTIAEINFQRIKSWSVEHNKTNSKPAILSYVGDIFKQMSPHSYTDGEETYAQKNLRIISGVYGILKAYDLIKPYRLEIKAKLKIKKQPNLYRFWQNKLTESLIDEIKQKGERYLVNLASAESFKAIKLQNLPLKIITVEFRERRGDNLVNVAIYSKMARGMMIDYMVKNLIEDPNALEGFNTKGYEFLKWEGDSIFFAR